MNKVITAIFDGETLHPETPLDLPPNQRYKITVSPLIQETEKAQSLSLDPKEISLIESAELYAEIYEEDEDLQELTESALRE